METIDAFISWWQYLFPALRRVDILWILSFPIYLLVGTFRHEASHALVVLVSGSKIEEFVFWPTKGHWGYVCVSDDYKYTILFWAAPYICDVIAFIVSIWFCMSNTSLPHWAWINIVIFGMISPLVNSANNYYVGVKRGREQSYGDVGELMRELPPAIVHCFFVVTVFLYTAGIVLVFSRSARAIAGLS